jgi:pimeloyl-ACP methyl ester carboxylesterase
MTTAEIYAYRQSELLNHFGTRTVSSYLNLPYPPVRAHVLSAGEGSPVVMVHGGDSVAAALEPLLGRVARAHRVYAPDRPGCGLTEPFDYRGIDLRRHGVAFIESLLDGLGLHQAALVANSMGGY